MMDIVSRHPPVDVGSYTWTLPRNVLVQAVDYYVRSVVTNHREALMSKPPCTFDLSAGSRALFGLVYIELKEGTDTAYFN